MVILLYSEAFPYNTRIGINSPACCQLFAVGAYGCMASFLYPADTSEQAVYRLLRLFSKVRAYSFRCSSFSAKGRVRVACSLVNALTTALAHYQPFAGTQGSCIFFVVPFQSECLYGHSDFYFSNFVMNIGTTSRRILMIRYGILMGAPSFRVGICMEHIFVC